MWLPGCSACLSALLFLQGCPAKPPPGGRFPITNGSHTILPTTDQQILIWADPPLTEVAVEWLRAHHYANIQLPREGSRAGASDLSRFLNPQSGTRCRTGDESGGRPLS